MSTRFSSSTTALTRNTNLPPIGTYTILGWFKVTASTGGNSAFFSYGESAGGYHEILVTSSLQLEAFSSGGPGAALGSTLKAGIWYHIAATINGTGAGGFRVYLNGALNITHTAGSVLGQLIEFGNTYDNEWLNGCAARVEVYSRVLSNDEIRSRMARSRPPRDRSLNGYYPLIGGQRHRDYSGNGYHMTTAGTLRDDSFPIFPTRFTKYYLLDAGVADTDALPRGITVVQSQPFAALEI